MKFVQQVPEKQSHLINTICIEECHVLLCSKTTYLCLSIKNIAVSYVRHCEKINNSPDILMSFDTASQIFSIISSS
jgi:hypothetical protein